MIPEALIREAARRGIDVVDVLARALDVDPSERAEAHLELAEKFLGEGKALVDKDPVQASEKLYEAAEEAVKALAIALGLDEAKTALEQGRWTAALLFSAVDSLGEKLGSEELRLWWKAAWFLHVEGLHEARLSPRQVARDLKHVEALVGLAHRYCAAGEPHR